MKRIPLVLSAIAACLCCSAFAARPLVIIDSPGAGDLALFDGTEVVPIVVEAGSDQAVLRAVKDLAEDFARVTSANAEIQNQIPPGKRTSIIIGVLGQSTLVDELCAQGKLDTNGIAGQWESYVLQVVTNPAPDVSRALVIAGSDRRGTIYGIYQLSEMMGVSPWYWWADVPVAKRSRFGLRGEIAKQGPPGVKYRGIFINDEDWGLYPWAARTFDPAFGNIGPKTYAKVFELMLRLRLNYLWPAMHEVSREFGSVPENYQLAGRYGLVMGSSHCEPMLYNNAKWNERQRGRWNYSLNRDVIHSTWEDYAKARGDEEAVWTLGIRGIHDAGMQRPPDDRPGRIKLMEQVFQDQRELLDKYVTKRWGPVAQCFVPYKEVLPIYDAGLKVPEDVTLVWVDDNFGFIRRLSNPDERKRPGGAGVYWHLSYYGGPHSYLWINTTAPALMWEELHKAWENEARTMWVINVGDIKPMEIGIDYFAKLAWNPDGFPLADQRRFLLDFAAENIGGKRARKTTDLLMDFYRLGAVRKPELMERRWAMALTDERAKQLAKDYQNLLDDERLLARKIPAERRDAYVEMVGFPARILAMSGQIFLADREVQYGRKVSENRKTIERLRLAMDAQVGNYNTNLAGGKWQRMMPGAVTAGNLMAWNSQVRWPWGEPTNHPPPLREQLAERNWRDAATWDRHTPGPAARWAVVEGLGPSGRAVALQPASLAASWAESDPAAPTLEFDFKSKAGEAEAWVDFLPVFRLYPGMKLRVAVSVDDHPARLVEVPGSSGTEDENGRIRNPAVQDNFVRAHVALPALSSGRHTLKIRAVDPGAVIDRVWLP